MMEVEKGEGKEEEEEKEEKEEGEESCRIRAGFVSVTVTRASPS